MGVWYLSSLGQPLVDRTCSRAAGLVKGHGTTVRALCTKAKCSCAAPQGDAWRWTVCELSSLQYGAVGCACSLSCMCAPACGQMFMYQQYVLQAARSTIPISCKLLQDSQSPRMYRGETCCNNPAAISLFWHGRMGSRLRWHEQASLPPYFIPPARDPNVKFDMQPAI